MTATAEPTDALTDAPTIGAVRRARGPAPEARHMLAVAIAEEAIRWAAIDRLDGIYTALHHGAHPHHIAQRLRQLADHLDPHG